MKVTKSKLIAINNNLFAVSKVKGVKFAYAVSKNKRKLEEEMTALHKMQEPEPEYLSYEQELKELAKKHARRDGNNQPETQIAPNGAIGYVIDDDNLIFTESKKKLDKKYKKAISKRKESVEEMDEILNEEIDLNTFSFHNVKVSDLPNELNAEELELLEFMIQD